MPKNMTGIMPTQNKPLVELKLDSDIEISISDSIDEIDQLLEENKSKISKIDEGINKLTSHADTTDYIVAACSGVLTGVLDALLVKETNFKSAKADVNASVNRFITSYAQKEGYTGSHLEGAISFLERKFPVAQDNIWKDNGFSSTRLHHLDDFAHHPTIMGLCSAILVQFLRVSMFSTRDGSFRMDFIDSNSKEAFQKVLNFALPIIVSGLLIWIVHVAESKYKDQIDEKIPTTLQKIIKGIVLIPGLLQMLKALVGVFETSTNWVGHLVSDMGGSKNTAGGGMGIPGVFLSILKEMSALPILNETSLPQKVSDWYSHDHMDMRTELAALYVLKQQAWPVIVNECIVRSFYFIRHLIIEKKEHDSWKDINWDNVIPWGNRTIARMMTVASGTFMATDMVGAAIKSGLKSHSPQEFGVNFLLNINFVGIGRFAIALGNDLGMEIAKNKLEKERFKLYTEQLHLYDAKISYKQADMWISDKEAMVSIEHLQHCANSSVEYAIASWKGIKSDLLEMSSNKEKIEQQNPGLLDDIKNFF